MDSYRLETTLVNNSHSSNEEETFYCCLLNFVEGLTEREYISGLSKTKNVFVCVFEVVVYNVFFYGIYMYNRCL